MTNMFSSLLPLSAWTSETITLPNWTATAGLILLALILTTLTSVYAYWTRRYNHWKNQGVKGPTPVFPYGNATNLKQKSIHDQDAEDIATYGRVHGRFHGNTPVLVIAEPDMIKDALVKDFTVFSDRQVTYHSLESLSLFQSNGGRWKTQRNIISPTFTSGKMKAMHGLMKQAVDHMLQHLKERVEEEASGQVIEVDNKKLFGNLSLGVIARCAFATDVNTHDAGQDEHVFVKSARQVFEFEHNAFFMDNVLPEWIKRMIGYTIWPKDPMNLLLSLSQEILVKRKQALSAATKGRSSGKAVDLLQLLLDAELRQEDGSSVMLTDQEVVSNIYLFLIAGYDTTSNLLSVATYLLALHPDVQQRLRSEIAEAVEADDNEIKYDTIMSLKYLDAVINESLRLYSLGPEVERRATRDYTLSKGISIKKGDMIHVPIFSIHRDPEFYPDPLSFNPDRFMPDNRHDLVPYTFMPFVLGPRNCIGSRFALLEGKTALAAVLLQYDLSPCDKTPIPLDLSGSNFALHLNGQVIIRYHKRP